jgi:hypothetical protein
MKFIISLFAVLSVLYGCATPAPPVVSGLSYVSIPEIGKTATAEVGQTIISRGFLKRTDAIILSTDAFEPVGSITVRAGVLPQVGQNETGKFYSLGQKGKNSVVKSLLLGGVVRTLMNDSSLNTMNDNFIGIFVPHNRPTAPVIYSEGGASLGSTPIAGIEHTSIEEYSEGAFKRELLYTGMSQSTITILYREFKNDFARPAFSQDLKYDLSQGRTIGFKGARFEVESATNTEIVYKVTKLID